MLAMSKKLHKAVSLCRYLQVSNPFLVICHYPSSWLCLPLVGQFWILSPNGCFPSPFPHWSKLLPLSTPNPIKRCVSEPSGSFSSQFLLYKEAPDPGRSLPVPSMLCCLRRAWLLGCCCNPHSRAVSLGVPVPRTP